MPWCLPRALQLGHSGDYNDIGDHNDDDNDDNEFDDDNDATGTLRCQHIHDDNEDNNNIGDYNGLNDYTDLVIGTMLVITMRMTIRAGIMTVTNVLRAMMASLMPTPTIKIV